VVGLVPFAGPKARLPSQHSNDKLVRTVCRTTSGIADRRLSAGSKVLANSAANGFGDADVVLGGA
jgi:hypothetical protein